MTMFEIDTLAHYDNRLFFAQALSHGREDGKIAPEKVDAIHQEIAALAHKLITIRAEDFSSQSELSRCVEQAFLLTSLGLEYGSQGERDKAVGLLNKNRIIKFFQIGNTLVDKCVQYAQNTLEKAVLISPEAWGTREQIPVYNDWERQFIEAVPKYQLVIDAPQVVIHQLTPARPLARLQELAVINQQLDLINHRLQYAQTLPPEKVFVVEYPPNTDGDTLREVTIALMVNLILYREIDFHLDPDDLENFCDIAYDAEHGEIRTTTRDRLIGWSGHYLESAGQPEAVKKYAVAYWRECLKALVLECRTAVSALQT
jgi:hypothetical protein